MKKTITFGKLLLSFLLGVGLSYSIMYCIPHISEHKEWNSHLREIEQKSLSPLKGILMISPQSWEVDNNLESKNNSKAIAALVSPSELKQLPMEFNTKTRLSIYLLHHSSNTTYSKSSFFNTLLEQATPEQQTILNLAYKHLVGGEKPYLSIVFSNINDVSKEVLEGMYENLYEMTKNNNSMKTLILLD